MGGYLQNFCQTTSGNLWTSTSVSYDIYSDLSLGVEEGLRLNETTINQTYSDVFVKYKVSKHFRVGVTWRNGQKNG